MKLVLDMKEDEIQMHLKGSLPHTNGSHRSSVWNNVKNVKGDEDNLGQYSCSGQKGSPLLQ